MCQGSLSPRGVENNTARVAGEASSKQAKINEAFIATFVTSLSSNYKSSLFKHPKSRLH